MATLLRPGSSAWSERFNSPLPGTRNTLVFLSSDGAAAGRCASIASNLGFMRCLVLDGGLEALGGGGSSRVPRFAYISRCVLSWPPRSWARLTHPSHAQALGGDAAGALRRGWGGAPWGGWHAGD